jgi:hypothetical protein
LPVEPLARRLGLQRGAAGTLDMVGLKMRCIPEYHHRISDVFVDRPSFCKERVCQGGEVPRRLMHENVGIRPLGNRSSAE